jgi:hypothetical protein
VIVELDSRLINEMGDGRSGFEMTGGLGSLEARDGAKTCGWERVGEDTIRRAMWFCSVGGVVEVGVWSRVGRVKDVLSFESVAGRSSAGFGRRKRDAFHSASTGSKLVPRTTLSRSPPCISHALSSVALLAGAVKSSAARASKERPVAGERRRGLE